MKNLTIVIVSALCLVLTACGGDDGSESGNAGALVQLSKTECSQLFTYNKNYSIEQNTDQYGNSSGSDKYYSNYEDQSEMYVQTVAGNTDMYESESGDQSYECVREVQSTYTTPVKETYTAPVTNTYTAPVKETYTAPVVVAPVKEVYTAPVKETYTAPVVTAPVKNY